SPEKNLPEKWSLSGENLAWKAPYGGRSTPVILGDHLYLQNTAGSGPSEQERLLCFNADTGKLLWEHKTNMYQSDVPAHRIAWSSPVADPETGNVYTLTGAGTLVALSKDGKVLWEHSFTEEFVPFTTHGGRTITPLIDGDHVIIAMPISTWGKMSNRAQRFIAIDKRNGQVQWVSTPGGRPFDTTYSALMIANVDGVRQLITGGSDGAVISIQANTGKPIWTYKATKRGLNTAIVMAGHYAIVSHSEENLEGNDMGLIAAIDATGKGALGKDHVKWAVQGWMGGFSNPLSDGDRIYQADNGANLEAFDSMTGRRLWKQNLGVAQKAGPVLGDGKLYVGSENGKFYILRPHADKVDILSEVELPISQTGIATEHIPEPVIASAAIARGRVYFASTDTLYAIGPKGPGRTPPPYVKPAAEKGDGPPAWVEVSPTELVLKPGEAVNFKVKLFDDKGRFLREDTSATWKLDGIKGTVANGKLTVAGDNVGQAGIITATVGGISGEARARVIPPMPWNETFDSYAVGSLPPNWVSAVAGKFHVTELEGQKVLEKQPDATLFKRMRVFMGPTDWKNYTVESDVRFVEKRRQMGDLGIVAQRYTLFLFGSSDRLEINPWQPETKRSVGTDFKVKADTWYHMKLRVQNMPDGKVQVQGKAWEKGQPEPAKWMVERIDPIGNREGSPGLFADSQFGAFFDNYKVTSN
ncbi:MAG: PQQ-binding-like beta-propeller repeat protein, partial [Bryobacteraceae bacterium]